MKIMTGHISHHGIAIPSVATFRVSAREGHAVVQSAPSGLYVMKKKSIYRNMIRKKCNKRKHVLDTKAQEKVQTHACELYGGVGVTMT
jgi:hypothetical protein